MFTEHYIDINTPNETATARLYTRLFNPKSLTEIKNQKSIENSPILLVHDSLGSVEQWKQFPQKLADATHRIVIAYDRLGFGKSTPNKFFDFDTNFIEYEARYIIPQILDFFNINNFVILGHSVGGGIATATASIYKDRCKALIVISTQAYNDEQIVKSIKENYTSLKDNLKPLERYHQERANWVLDFWKTVWLSDEFKDWSLLTFIENVTCPTLVIQGENDEYNDVKHSQTIYQYINTNNKSLIIMRDVGHFPHKQQEDVVIDYVADFISDKLTT